MKDTLRLLLLHLRMLPHAVTIAYLFGGSRGLLTCIQPLGVQYQGGGGLGVFVMATKWLNTIWLQTKRASNLVNKGRSEPQLECTPYC
jgi:hypothetical protein